jgi:hypothetical protein
MPGLSESGWPKGKVYAERAGMRREDVCGGKDCRRNEFRVERYLDSLSAVSLRSPVHSDPVGAHSFIRSPSRWYRSSAS